MRLRAVVPAIHGTVGAFFLAALVFHAGSATMAQSETKIWTGVFSAAQVERGKETFEPNCARCHQSTLGGSDRGPALKGENFWSHWEHETVNSLFIKVRDNMPPNLTGNQLERDVRPVVDGAGFESVHDVRMGAQCRCEHLLDREHPERLVVAHEMGVQALEGDGGFAARGTPHLAESPDRDECLELPVAEAYRHVGDTS